MNNKGNLENKAYMPVKIQDKVGFYSSIALALITIVTFGLAIIAVPISGANAPGGGIPYPYLDTLKQFPKDYIWMFSAILLIVIFLIFIISIASIAEDGKKIFSEISMVFAIIAAVILLIDYFIQIAVIPVSLFSNETEGIALVTQYNPHGIFIALEELGYIIMNFSFLFLTFIFTNKSRLEKSINWIFLGSFFLVNISLIMISILYGIDRKDRFEVLAISISWLVLIINGILVSIFFKRRMKKSTTSLFWKIS